MRDKEKKAPKMDYSNYVGIVRETNRPSGGIKTIQTVCVNAHITDKKKVLEIGCNTGFTSRNIHLLTGAEVIGIDLNKKSILAANETNALFEITRKVNFMEASVINLPFKNEEFDVVWLSNVLSFIKDKEVAVRECFRVLKDNGFLILVPIYYKKNPPKKLLKKVEEAINTKISVRTKEDWIKLIRGLEIPIEICFEKDFVYKNVKSKIQDYLSEVFNKEHINKMSEFERKTLFKEGKKFMELFNENLKYASFSIFIIQKRKFKEEVELFVSKPYKG